MKLSKNHPHEPLSGRRVPSTCLLAAAAALLSSTSVFAQQLSVVVPVLPGSENPADSRAAHFNWEFESSGGGDVQTGQFACGSHWVAPANGDTGVIVLSLGGNPAWTDYVSCDADPVPESHGLLDGSNNYGSYNAAENIVPNLPMTFTPASGSCISLVAAMQRNEAATSPSGTSSTHGESTDAYCVVTILPAPPPNGGSDMIRPNITGATKEFLTWDDFDLTRIPEYSFIDGKTSQGWQDTQVRWSHSIEIFGGLAAETSTGTWVYFSEGGRAFRSQNLIDEYGSGMSSAFNDDLLALFSGDESADRDAALAAMLSFGLDIYHARFNYGTAVPKAWLSGAGQQPGKFLPTVLLASLLVDQTKADVLRRVAIDDHAEDPALFAPQELRQITRGVTGVLLWGDGHPFIRSGNNINEQDRRYWSNLKIRSVYDAAVNASGPTRKNTIADPYGYIDGPAEEPGTSYMGVTFGVFRSFAAAMILMPEIRGIVNTDAPIEYVDRLITHGRWTAPDPVATIPIIDQEDEDCNPYKFTPNCNEFMVTWGPDPSDIRFAIEDGTGRFTSRHGEPITPENDGTRARDEWASIIALYNGDDYLDNAVDLGEVVSPEILFDTGPNPEAHIFCATRDAEIRYTLNGTDPTTSSTLYTGPISISDQTEVRARAYLTGMTPSTVQSETFDDPSPGSTDIIDPTVPTGLSASNVTSSTVDLDWNASSDNVAVTEYNIYTNGSNPVGVSSTSVTLLQLSPDTNYTFTVSALDAANNESAQSSGVSVTTEAASSPTIIAVTASEEDGSAVAANTIDGNLSTRWSAHGPGQWIEWELDGSYTIAEVSIAFYNGDSRNYDFVLEVSDDGSNWTQVYSGQSSGSTTVLEVFDVTDTTGTYVRYVGNGNSSNDWNALTEVEVEGSGADVTAPDTPTGLSIDHITAASVGLSWNASIDDVGVTGYNVYTNGSDPAPIGGTSAVVEGLTPSTSYTFTVSAFDAAANESPQSNSVQPTTAANGNSTIDMIAASSDDGNGNVAGNTTDGNLSTRWSAHGDGQWIDFQLDGIHTIEWIDIAFYNGSSRSYDFDIQVSTDGSNWTTVYSGQSSGSTTTLETFDVTDTAASHIRYLGHGNSVNDWNALTEVELGL